MRLLTIVRVDAIVVVGRTHEGGRLVEVSNDEEHVVGDAVELAIGELDDDGILWVSDRRAVAVSVVAVGDRRVPRVRLVGSELPGGAMERDPATLGLRDYRDTQRAQRVRYLVLDPNATPPGHWDHDGGIEGWRVAIEEDDRAREQAAHEAAARRMRAAEDASTARLRASTQEEWSTKFVNPYTFVPFPDGEGDDVCPRAIPIGHERLHPGRLAGTVTVTWKALTPLLVRGSDHDDDVVRFPRRPSPTGEPVLVIPGSSVKGSIRSLHETLCGGCLRVLDVDFVPVYRDSAVARPAGWTLGLVEAVDDDGRPLAVNLCADVVWARAEHLRAILGGPKQLRTGARVGIAREFVRMDPASHRREVSGAGGVTIGCGWVVLVTDPDARHPAHPYFCATGALTERRAVVTEEAWNTYLHAVEGSKDVREAQKPDGPAVSTREVPVEFPRDSGKVIGYRRIASRSFAVGDVIWAHPEGQTRIEQIALSALWRHQGQHPLGERVPKDLLPCTSPELLCGSCRLFGSADPTGGRRPGAARQDAYQGHVRVGDAIAVEASIETVRLAPLGNPRPGAGQFYLRHRRHDPATDWQDRTTREWGASPDSPDARQARGRKYYWHGDPESQSPPRHRAREAQSDKLKAWAETVVAGSTFQGRVSFDNLTEAELGGLLAALDPSLLLPSWAPPGFAEVPVIAGHLGGGKPLGLGSVEVLELRLVLHSGASRYAASEPSPRLQADELVGAFVESTPAPLRATWRHIAAVLNVGHVYPAAIWYPPGAPWDEAGSERFDDGFTFWKKSAGRFVKPDKPQEPILALADPGDVDQYHEIIERQGP